MLPQFILNPNPNIYLEGTGLVIDIETTNNHKGDARYPNEVICFSTALVRSCVVDYSSFRYSTSISSLSDTLFKGTFDFIIAHNAKFELEHFIKLGIPINDFIIYDTMLSEKVIVSNRGLALDLGSVSKRYGGTGKEYLVDKLIKGQVCPSSIPETLLRRRVIKDVKDTAEVFVKQVQTLREEGTLGVAYTKNLFSAVVADMEMKGLYLDRELVRELATIDNLKHSEILQELDKITGGINLASPDQKAEFIYGELGFKIPKLFGREYRTPGGKPSTDETAIGLLKPKTKKQTRFIELVREESKLRKRITTYHNMFIDAVENNDCYIYGSINQHITNTQRLSSSQPNLQNIDRKLKKVVTFRNKGWKVRQNDYSQLEFRVAGFLAQCPVALQDIKNKVDVHSNTASVLFDGYDASRRPEPAIEEMRTEAKADTFKPLYGGESGTERQQAYYEWFKKHYSGITEWQRNLMSEALSNNYITTITGLRFYFPNTRLMENGNVTRHTAIKNYPVQYFATGEIAVIGTLILWHYLKAMKLQSFIVNEVHDSVIIEEHPEEHKIVEKLSYTAMIEDTIEYLRFLYGIDFNFPLDIDTELKTNWSYNK